MNVFVITTPLFYFNRIPAQTCRRFLSRGTRVKARWTHCLTGVGIAKACSALTRRGAQAHSTALIESRSITAATDRCRMSIETTILNDSRSARITNPFTPVKGPRSICIRWPALR
jgi:hypothetical protein